MRKRQEIQELSRGSQLISGGTHMIELSAARAELDRSAQKIQDFRGSL